MPTGGVGLSWGFYALFFGYTALIGMAAWVAFDTFRPARLAKTAALDAATGGGREPITWYRWYCVGLVILYLIQQIISVTVPAGHIVRTIITGIGFLWTVGSIPVMLMYLLRVVFPKVPESPECKEVILAACLGEDPYTSNTNNEKQTAEQPSATPIEDNQSPRDNKTEDFDQKEKASAAH